MRQTISRQEAIRLVSRAREAACEPSVLQELLNDYGVATVFDALLEAYAGVSNGFLTQVCEAITGQTLEVTGTFEPRLPCPCCKRRTLTELFDSELGTGYDVCDYCRWEDDGTTDARTRSSANRGSMEEYRDRIRSEQNYYAREKWPE